MTTVITQQSAENMAYVRCLLRQRHPGFSAALEKALDLADMLERGERTDAVIQRRHIRQAASALAITLMTNTALTGGTYDVDGGQQLIG